MTDSKFLDSSVWLSYFYGESEEIKSIIESNDVILTSAISILEIKRKLLKEKMEHSKIQRSLEFMKRRSLIVSIDSEVAEKAVEVTIAGNLHTVDALIYASALQNNAHLLTLDNDFRNLKNVIVLGVKRQLKD